jgi:hypothetical protein
VQYLGDDVIVISVVLTPAQFGLGRSAGGRAGDRTVSHD